MKNIRIIKTGINVSKIQRQLEQYAEDWGNQKTLPGVELQDPRKLYTCVEVLQLVMGALEHEGQYVGDRDRKSTRLNSSH